LSVTNANGTPSSITKYVQITSGSGGVTDTINHIGSTTTETLSGYGTYAWTCPSGVYSVSALLVGGGAAGTNGGTSTGVLQINFTGVGGQNGGTQSPTNIPVVPGQTYQFVVGRAGQNTNTTANVVNIPGTGTVTYIYRNASLYSTSVAGFLGASTTYQSADPLAGLSTTAFGYTANGGLAGMYQINAGWSGPNYNGVVGAATNGITSPISGNYVTYGGSGGGQGYVGGNSGGGNGYGYINGSSTAGSFYGAGGGAGDGAGITDTGKSGSNGVIILNYQQQTVILPPVINFNGTPLTGYPPLTVQFTDLSSNGPTSWNWGFGDGTNSTLQNPSHIYQTNGTYSVSLIASNINGTSSSVKAGYIVVSSIPVTPTPTNAPQSNTVWFVPKTVHIQLIDKNTGSPIIGAQVSGQFLSASGLPGGVSDLINYYGMNLQAANNAANGTLFMNSTTDSDGFVVLTMLQTLQYGVTVTNSQGVTNYFTLNPQNAEYTLRFTDTTYVDTTVGKCIVSNGNTWTGITSNINVDPNNMYLLFSYQDTCGLTNTVTYYVIDKGTDSYPQNNLLYTYTLSNPGTAIATNNVSVPNTQFENYQWYENYTRSV
jgi:PKD repeat protein